MISKEEINFLEVMIKEYSMFGDLQTTDYEDTERIMLAIKHLLEAYGQLENKQQKVIEKLEKDSIKFKEQNADGSLQSYIDEILGIVKGE